MFKKWELALMAGLLVSLLISPARAEHLPLSRWRVPTQPAPAQYQVCLFPFAVGAQIAPALSPQSSSPQPGFEIRFQLLDWWEQIQNSINP